jgi:hypothetical protein
MADSGPHHRGIFRRAATFLTLAATYAGSLADLAKAKASAAQLCCRDHTHPP